MSEPVTIGRATLYLGDCREILPTLGGVEAIITDPPYGIGAGEMKLGNAAAGRVPTSPWDSEAPDLKFVLDRNLPTIIWGAQYFGSLPPQDAWIIWFKGEGMRGRSFAEAELAWTNLSGKTRQITVAPNNAPDLRQGRVHKCQKPLAVMDFCIERIPDAVVICDPFCGSGSTGVSAIRKGRSFVGIEKDPHFFAIMCRRIREATGEDAGPLFGEAAA